MQLTALLADPQTRGQPPRRAPPVADLVLVMCQLHSLRAAHHFHGLGLAVPLKPSRRALRLTTLGRPHVSCISAFFDEPLHSRKTLCRRMETSTRQFLKTTASEYLTTATLLARRLVNTHIPPLFSTLSGRSSERSRYPMARSCSVNSRKEMSCGRIPRPISEQIQARLRPMSSL